jgi:SET domain-containing protein
MLTVKTKLDKSNISGIGLFANQTISKGDTVWKIHTISVFKINRDKYDSLSEIEKQFIQEKDYYWLDDDGNYMLPIDDSRFVNHSNNPNITEVDDDCCVASRDININEELTIDYKTLVPKEHWKEFML